MVEHLVELGPALVAVNPNDIVDTRLDNKTVPMMGCDINNGPLVAVESTQGALPIYELPDLDKLLYQKSVKYRLAKDALFQKNNDGEHIRNLRILLLQGLTEERNKKNLEQKIMQQNLGFSSEEINEFRDEICDYVKISPNRAKEWLTGETVLPKDIIELANNNSGIDTVSDNVAGLININSEFEKIAKDFKNKTGTHQRYRDYVDARSLLRKYMKNGYKWQVGKKYDLVTKGKWSPNTGRFNDEIAILDAECQKEDPTKGFFRAHSGKKYDNKNHDLDRKVKLTTKKNDDSTMSPNELFTNLHVLENALNDMLNTYITSFLSTEYVALKPFLFANLISNNGLEKQILKINMFTDDQLRGRIGGEDHLFEILDQFVDELDSGLVDERMGSEFGTAKKLIDSVQEYRNGVYDSFHKLRESALELYYESIMIKPYIKPKKRKNLPVREMRNAFLDIYFAEFSQPEELWKDSQAKKIVKAKKQKIIKLKKQQQAIIKHFKDDYGYRPETKMFMESYFQQKTDEKVASYHQPNGSVLLRDDLKRDRVKLYKKSEVLEILTKKGIPDAINYIDSKNFNFLNPDQ